ncbi:DNA repair protein RecN [Gloeocapsa sp. PCC 73106]|uniref:DNA repair protein RecN n=1 Tax=Gloeocapsa sp. PCC 73106 TaxID=102232 RepID=UPI0002ABC794|nr:DNA repair protein RecN [Gloeocapsa sp. PCC 73106]ELR97100.1 DNA repair protein RecN [Gloeocapsa sp. PCC 73106]
MLDSLRIKNFALIDYLELELGPGLNVLTGETGAGKSIVLDAIDVVLGGKVNQRLVRQGEQRALIEAIFRPDIQTQKWFQEQELDPLEEDTVVCSREIIIAKDNLRSRFRVNGVLVNRQLVLQIRDRLLEITAQGQTVELMIPEKQRQLLDLYGGVELIAQRERVSSAYDICQKLTQSLAKRRQSEQERLQRLDLIRYQSQELTAVGLTDGEELEQLEQTKERLAHVVELQQLSYQLYQLLYQNERGERAASDFLGDAEVILKDMLKYDGNLESLWEMVSNALTQVVEAGQQIQVYGESLEADPHYLEQVEERIQQLKRICRKYGPSLAEVLAYAENLARELEEINEDSQSLETLEQEYTKAQADLTQACSALTLLRQEAASKLEEQLTKELKPLGMEKVVFACRIFSASINGTGGDQVVYYFSPNPGEKIQPLSLTASGGEMSRFLLALKTCFVNAKIGSKTLIFDEIDVGVSGKVAQAIANQLHSLSHIHQVLCVTHQPLIAAMADIHFRVEKQIVQEQDLRTVVRVFNLSNHQQRREELAQLSGGQADQDAITFADSLLAQAQIRRATMIKKY